MALTENASSQSDLIVWYIPGFLTGLDVETHEEINERLSLLYPKGTTLETKPWNDFPIGLVDVPRNWQNCLIETDKESKTLFDCIQKMSPTQQRNLTLIGHSLGGNIAVKTTALCHDNNIQIKRMVLFGAAIDNDAPEIEKAIEATLETNYSFVNMEDRALKLYRNDGGTAALGTGYIKKVDGNKFREIFAEAAKNHKSVLYLQTFEKCVKDNLFCSSRVIVPQDATNIKMPVMDSGIWWQRVDNCQGWELQQNIVTTSHYRIINPNKLRVACGKKIKMVESFARVKDQLEGSTTLENLAIEVPQRAIGPIFSTAGGKVFWDELKNYMGWKLQKNKITGHCRILDPDDIRRTWGFNEDEMRRAFKEVKRQLDEKRNQIGRSEESASSQASE